MKLRYMLVLTVVIFRLAADTNAYASAAIERMLSQINLPEGFSISLYAKVPGARSLSIAPELNAVFVGTRANSVYIIKDKYLKGQPEKVSLFLDGLNVPNGIVYKNNRLFVAEQHRIIAVDPATKNKSVIIDNLPDKRWHGWRYLALAPGGNLFVSIGAPCNVCTLNGLEGSILEVDPQTGSTKKYATGVRNSVGMDFHPLTGELYFTDNGSDGLGDEIPADELNHAPIPGSHFGFPYYGGGTTRTNEFASVAIPSNTTPPIVEFAAHTASLGIRFYRGSQFPETYRNTAFIAQHGSWDRSTPIGYRIMQVRFDEKGRAQGKKIFADGWLRNGEKLGRVVDIKELPDGSLLVSDDLADVVYRISYEQ